MKNFIIFSVLLFLIIFVFGSIAFFFSMRQIIRTNKGSELSQMLEIERIQLETSVNAEIAIVLKLADSPLIKRYFSRPGNPELERDAFEEIASYRQAFSGYSIFWINDIDMIFYSDDNEPYVVDANDPVNYWYNMTIYDTESYNFNINYNPDIEMIKLWINAPVFNDEHRSIGMVGTGIELSEFTNRIYQGVEEKTNLYFFNKNGEIYGAKDIGLIKDKVNITNELRNIGIDILDKAKELKQGETQAFDVTNGKIAIGAIPSLEWYAVAFMSDSIADYDTAMSVLFIVVLVLILLIFVVFNLFVSRLLKSLHLSMKETERQNKTIAEQFHRYRAILDATPLPISVTDSDMNWTFVNKAVEKFLGMKREDMMGAPCSNWNAHICNTPDCGIARVKRGLNQTFFKHNDSSYKVDVEVLKDLNGETSGFIEVVQDITLVETMARREAEAASQAKSNFLATMSHEIRTPMNAIIGIAQIELQKEAIPGEYAVALEKIYSSGNSLLGIINDILDMSKIETGKLELNPVEYDVPSLINDTVQLNIVRIGSKPIEFILDLDENLPTRLCGDELRLKQILNNLLSNAIKYTEKGRVRLVVKHWHEEDGDITLSFSVEDTGQGMKLEDRDKFFSEYQRFNTEANRANEGTGLGLSITKNLVEMMNGTIWAESEYGRGSAFLVTVRQKAVECAAIGAETAERLCSFKFVGNLQAEKLQITRSPMPYGRVLVVDDVDTNLYVAEGVLSPYKLNIETADSGFAAIDMVKSGGIYDVIFMDHMMPLMDGIEAAKKLREFGYTGVIVALTANAIVGNDEMFMQNGFDGFISKPIDLQQMNTVLNQFIRDRHPDEAEKYKPEATIQAETIEIESKIRKIFCGDAEKAVVTLRETVKNGDFGMFTITAHAMKSALANIGESEASSLASELESAGINGDKDYIAANTENFVKLLEGLIHTFTPAENGIDAEVVEEDTVFLTEQLRIVKAACEAYDDDAAYAALDRLKEKPWNKNTAGMLEQIRDALFIYSDFDGVIKTIHNGVSPP